MLSLRCLPGHRNLVVTFLVAVFIFTISGLVAAQQQQQQTTPPPQPLPTEVLSAETLTAEQLQQIEQFVSQHVQRIMNARNPATISDSRQRVLDALRNREITSAAAHSAISERLAVELQNVTQDNRLAVRATALLLIAELSGVTDQVLPIINDSIAHSSPGVRYLSARTMVRLAQRGEDDDAIALSTDQQNSLLESLSAAIADEADNMVLGQMYQAAGVFTVPESRQVLLGVLTERINGYTGGLTNRLVADQHGIASLRQAIAYDRAQNRSIDDSLRQLTVLSARLLDVISQALQDEQVDEALQPVAVRAVSSVEEVFSLALTHFDPTADGGRELAQPAQSGNFDDLRLNVLEWIGTADSPGMLTESAISIESDRIHLNP